MQHLAAETLLLVVPALHGEDSVDSTTVSFLLSENLKVDEEGGGDGEEASVGGEGEEGGAREGVAGDRPPSQARRASHICMAAVDRPPSSSSKEGEEKEEEETSSLPSSSQLQYIDKVVLLRFAVCSSSISSWRRRQIPDSAYSVEVPQSQFSRQSSTFLLCRRGKSAQLQTLHKTGYSTVQFLVVVHAPVVVERQVPSVHSCFLADEVVAAHVVDIGSWHVRSWFCWHYAVRAVFPFVVIRSKMLGILVGMDQKDSCAVRCSQLSSFFGPVHSYRAGGLRHQGEVGWRTCYEPKIRVINVI